SATITPYTMNTGQYLETLTIARIYLYHFDEQISISYPAVARLHQFNERLVGSTFSHAADLFPTIHDISIVNWKQAGILGCPLGCIAVQGILDIIVLILNHAPDFWHDLVQSQPDREGTSLYADIGCFEIRMPDISVPDKCWRLSGIAP